MQSSRRKRDRVEVDDQGTTAPTPSRTRSARGAAQKRLHTQHDVVSGTDSKNGTPVSVVEDSAMEDISLPQQDNTTISNSNENQWPSDGNGNGASDDTEGGTLTLNQSSAATDTAGSGEDLRTTPQSENQQQEAPGGSGEQSADSSNHHSREKRIAALLSHRRVVLSRIKRCRAAAQTRLGELQNQHGAAANKDWVSGEVATDEEEIDAFLELSRKAVNAAKKQRSDATSEGQSQEKRAPISLRRGSSVGKRMTMALSSLVPNAVGAPSSSTRESATLPLHEQNATYSSSVSTGDGLPGKGHGHRLGGTVGLPMGSSVHTSKIASNKKPPTTSSVVSIQGTHAGRAGAGSAASHKIKRSGTQKSTKSYGGPSRGSLITNSEHHSSIQPQHSGVGGNSLPANILAQPSVLYPESMALRDRRNSIRSRLASLLYERQKRLEEGETQPSSSRNFPKGFHIHHKDKTPPTSFASVAAKQRGPGPPPLLPRRRKTHWDFLLEEMRWLATDFIEERKWKASCARTISSAAVAIGRTAISPVKALLPADHVHKGSSRKEAEPIALEKGSSECKSKSKDDIDAKDDAKYERVRGRRYVSVSVADVKAARDVSTIMSDMIAELWDVSVDAGAMSASDKSHDVALKRHLKLRSKLLSDTCVMSKVREGEGEIGISSLTHDPNIGENTSDGAGNAGSDDGTGTDKSRVWKRIQPQEISYEQISERVEQQIQSLGARMDQEESEDDGRDDLIPSQIAARDFVQWLWGDDAFGGAILDGPPGSGKTVTACSLLQKREGPHLVLCSPARLFRWKYELCQVEDLRLRSFGFQCGISAPELESSLSSKYDRNEVVLCELSSILVNDLKGGLDVSAFSSVVLDCRFQSASSIDTNHPPGVNRSVRGDRKVVPVVPAELVSHSWWLALLDSLATVHSRRLLVESYGNGTSQDESMFGCSHLEDRQGVETLASKMAFLLGPALFYSKRRACTKKVLSWTKRRVNVETESADPNEKLTEMKKFLFQVMRKFSHAMNHIPSRVNDVFDWHARSCTLSEQQRTEYDRCCSDVRGALSFWGIETCRSLDSIDECCNAAGRALLRLRKVCFHPRMQDLVSNHYWPRWSGPAQSTVSKNATQASSSTPVCGSGCFNRAASQSSSQPDVALALEIMRSSAKLRELVTILHTECGYRIHGQEVIAAEIETAQLQYKKETKSRSNATPKKVVILASLSEAQLLTSLLLNAVGIPHEVLVRTPSATDRRLISSSSSCPGRTFASNSQTKLDPVPALSWIECQLALDRFNSQVGQRAFKDNALGRSRSVSVIVASPLSVAHLSGGIGVSSADMIVLLDEDWSGRGQLFSTSILSTKQRRSRSSTRASQRGEVKCAYIRLVCRDTCEDKFLSSGRGKSPMAEPRWSTDTFGYLRLPPATETKTSDDFKMQSALSGIFAFPGSTISKFQGVDLSSVLCLNQLPPDFATGSQTCFLPAFDLQDTQTSDGERNATSGGETGDAGCGLQAYASFVESLTQLESATCPLTSKYASGRQEGHNTLASLYLTIAPPLPADTPPMVATRRDVHSLPSRLYIEIFGKSFVMDSLGSVASSPSSLLHVQPENSFLMGPSDGNMELADAWHKSGLGCNPDDFATSLLVYRSSQSDNEIELTDVEILSEHENTKNTARNIPNIAEQSVMQPDETSVAATTNAVSRQSRSNTYSSSYSTSRSGQYTVVRDGNQGCEPKVYFPPLFPTVQVGCELAKTDILSLDRLGLQRSRLKGVNSLELDDGSGHKRKASESASSVAPRTGKRPRISHIPHVGPSEHPDPARTSVAQPSMPGEAHSATQANRAKPSAANSEVFGSGIDPVTEYSGCDASFLLHINEDFGLAGIGALGAPSASALASLLESVDVTTYSDWKDQFESNTAEQDYYSHFLVCDSEEADTLTTRSCSNTQLDTMLLFVAKKNVATWPPGPYHSAAKNGVGSSQGSVPSWASANIGMSSGSVAAGGVMGNGGLNGSSTSKKKKKTSQNATSAGASAFSRLPSVGFPGGSQSLNALYGVAGSKTSDVANNRFASQFATRQRRQGVSLFDYSSFRLAYVRLRNRVSDRVTQSSLEWSESSGVGTGVPSILLKGDTSLAQLLSQGDIENVTAKEGWTGLVAKASTGSDSRAEIVSEWTSARRSVEAPCRVDFGPFQAGYLSSSSAITAVSPPNPRIGVSLPMGVKMPFRRRDQLPASWTNDEDEALRKSASKFGLNFQLAAWLVSKAATVPTAFPDDESATRSARQCRERWDHLTNMQPSLAREVHQTARALIEKGAMTPYQIAQVFHDETKKSIKFPRVSTSVEQTSLSTVRLGSSDVLLPPALVFKGGEGVFTQDSGEKKDESGDVIMTESAHASSGPAVTKKRRSFAAFRNAASLKQEAPLAILGSTTGDVVPALVAPHPSHRQSVQAAVSRSPSASGRDMWPLQMLGIADKQRGVVSGRNTAQGSAVATSPSRSSGGVQQVARSNGPSTPQASLPRHQHSSPYK